MHALAHRTSSHPSCEAGIVPLSPSFRNPLFARAIVTLVVFAGCTSERPPPPGSDRDAGAPLDASTAGEAGADAAPFQRPPTPRLPGSNQELILPYLGPPQTVSLVAEAALGLLDIHLSVDTTGSFGEEIDRMQASLGGVIIPSLERAVPDVGFAVSRFEDFPAPPFGAPSDSPYTLLAPLTTSRARISSAVAALDDPLGFGGDVPESGFEALFQVATGAGYRLGGRTLIRELAGQSGGEGTLGGVGFREGAFRAAVHITDAPSHAPGDYGSAFPGTRGLSDVLTAAQAIELRILGIASGDSARPGLEALALGTGAHAPPTGGICNTGINGTGRAPVGDRCPLVFDIAPDGSGLSEAIVDAILNLLSTVLFDEVFAVPGGNRLGFLKRLVATDAMPEPGVAPPALEDRRPIDGDADTFTGVRPGTRLVFEATFQNTTLPAADYDQSFLIQLQLFGDALVLRSETIRVTVPRGRLGGDAGADGDAGAQPDAGSEP